MMITMVLAISIFYAVPEFKTSSYVPETVPTTPLQTLHIPPTRQLPPMAEPLRPSIPVESEEVDPDLELPAEISLELAKWDLLVPPEAPKLPTYSLSDIDVSEYPEPVGGWLVLAGNVNYPEIAREAGIQGIVFIEAIVDVDGRIIDPVVVKGVPRTGLDEAALKALTMTRFKPATQMGKPVRVRMTIPIHFRLKG